MPIMDLRNSNIKRFKKGRPSFWWSCFGWSY